MTKKSDLKHIRNIGIIAHIDAGKTTTTERMLYHTGKIYKIGDVDDGTTAMDWMQEEQERGITITSASTTCFWHNYKINIIDTPGHVDFTVEVERSLKILDGAVVVFCAVGGVEPQSETVWRQADRYAVPRIAFINKMDRTGSDFFEAVRQMDSKLGTAALPVQLPLGKEDDFKGIIDLVTMKAMVFEGEGDDIRLRKEDIPEDLVSISTLFHNQLIEKLAEVDENIMEKFAHSITIDEGELKAALRQATIKNSVVPVLCGASFRNKGVQLLLDAVCNYLPSPCDMPPREGVNTRSGEVEKREASDSEPFSALVFKIMSDPYVGTLAFIRVYSGVLNTGSYIYNANKDVKERVGKIVRMHAAKQEMIRKVHAGDIAAVVGLKQSKTGDTICDEDRPIRLETMHFPEPVISMAIEPKTKMDQEKFSKTLARLQEEDPSFRVRYNEETGQTLISGMGELHLEVLLHRMLREFKVDASVGKPHVAYKETVTKKITATGKFVQQTGGHGQYGHVVMELKPGERNTGIVFINKLKGGVIPREFVPAVEDGVEESAKTGVLAGYPVTDVEITLVDGSYHSVDSSELAFRMAGSLAFSDGVKKASPILLEPIMDIEVMIPEEYMGEVIGDLNSRRCKITAIHEKLNTKFIRGFVPLSDMFGYSTAIRSLTQGRGTYTMEPSYYAEVPGDIAKKIIG